MQMKLTDYSISTAAATDRETRPEFKLLIAYDDFANLRYAMLFLKRHMDEYAKHFAYLPSFLKFEDLMRPEVARQMVNEAAGADLVVIAAYGDLELPELVQDWIQKLGVRKGNRDSTLVALLSSSESGMADYRSANSKLCAAASRGKKKFLVRPIAWPAQEAAFPVKITRRSLPRVDSPSRHAQCAA